MAKRIISEEQKSINETKKYYDAQRNKQYNYNENDFSIDLLTLKWRHKSWKTWCKGSESYEKTKEIIKRYCNECKKPYGTRDLSFVHLF